MHKLKELRKINNFKQLDVAEKLNIPLSTYRSYENEECRINDEILLKLSKIFNVSIDAILNNDTKGKVVYSDEQKNAIADLCELNDDYLELASKYIKNLLADQVELESKRKQFKE